MKKLFAVALILAMLIPLGAVSASADGDFAPSPFYGLGWSDFSNATYPYLEGLVQSNFSTMGDRAVISYNGAKVIHSKEGIDAISDADVTSFAEKMKATMDARPEGLRYWHLWAPSKVLKLKPENAVYLDHGVDQMKDLVTLILKKYKELGGLLDGLVIDTEYTGMSSGSINATAKSDPYIYKKITEDPRYATEVRPLLAERNFPFFQHITDYTPEIYPIATDATAKAIWDTVMRNRLNNYCTEWAFEALMKYFPQATLSDYQSMDSYAWLKGIAITDDGQNYSGGGNSVKAGNVSCFSFYFARPTKAFYDGLDNYVSFNDAIYEASPFNTLLFDINLVRRMYESTDSHMIAPWITAYVYNSKKNGTLSYTPYYAEQIFHLGMLDPEPFLVYMYVGEYDAGEWADSCQTLNELLAELTRVAGFSDRRPIPLPQYWNSEYVLSGMYAGGRNIWRISPNTDEISLEDFKLAGTDPTFRVKGQTVTFPGGRIIETAAISNVGSCGYWVETSADVTPVITTDPDRFAKYPALQFTFEDQAPGAFTADSALPKTAWEITPFSADGTATIRETDAGKALALEGSVSVRSVKLPNNITAGDYYAKKQDWAVTVTLPEGLSGEADIRLLNYTGHQQKVFDGGFKISGGKVSYAIGGQSQEFAELCDLSAGTYIFLRSMDFTDGQDFRCNYCVFDTAGNLLAQACDIAVPGFAYIQSVGFSCANADKAVILDNYAIAVTGAAADFELYDAKTGIRITDTAAKRNSDTAYRLSWLNATGATNTVTVMAAIYEGDILKEERLIREVTMQPGCDGVETGIVSVAEGQAAVLYLKTEEPDEIPPVTEPPAAQHPVKNGDLQPVYLLVGAIVLGALMVIGALVITSPRKNKA